MGLTVEEILNGKRVDQRTTKTPTITPPTALQLILDWRKRCTIKSGESLAKQLYASYTHYCQSIKAKPVDLKAFCNVLTLDGIEKLPRTRSGTPFKLSVKV